MMTTYHPVTTTAIGLQAVMTVIRRSILRTNHPVFRTSPANEKTRLGGFLFCPIGTSGADRTCKKRGRFKKRIRDRFTPRQMLERRSDDRGKSEAKFVHYFHQRFRALEKNTTTSPERVMWLCVMSSDHFPCPKAAFGSLWREGRSRLFPLFGFAFCEGHLAFRDVDRDGVAVDDATFDQLHRERVEYAVLNDAL